MRLLFRSLLLLLLFCTPLMASQGSSPLTGPQKAKHFVDAITPIFDMHFSGDSAPLSQGGRYDGVALSEESGEIRFRDTKFQKATGLSLACTIAEDGVNIHIEESWDDAANDVFKEISKQLGLFFSQENQPQGAHLTFRHARFEFSKLYYTVHLTLKGGKENPKITLALKRSNRSDTPARFSNGKSQWDIRPWAKDGQTLSPKAFLTMAAYPDDAGDIFGIHRFELRFSDNKPELFMAPDIYPMWKKGADAKPGPYVASISGLAVDSESLAAPSRLNALKRKKDTFALPLSQEELARLSKGKVLTLTLATTLDESVRLDIPLTRFKKSLTLCSQLEQLNRTSPLLALVALEKHDRVKAAIARGENVNARSPEGLTALGIAVSGKDEKMIRILGTAKNLFKDDKNRQGDGHLHTAAHYLKGTTILDALLEIGCDPNIRDKEGRTPLSRTVCYEGYGKIDALVKAGGDINAPDHEGLTPLHHTVRNRFSDAQETAHLVKAGARINAKTNKGETPLMVAINNQCWAHISELLKQNASLSAKNSHGQTAYDLAKSYANASDLTEKIPVLVLQGEEAQKKTQKAYKDLATLLKNKNLYHLGFHNTTSETVFVALRIMDEDRDWVTKSWYKIGPDKKALVARTPNSIFYYFGESDSWVWKGDENYQTIGGERYGMRKITLDSKRKGEVYYHRLK